MYFKFHKVLYSFLIPAVTNCHKPGGLKEHTFIVLQSEAQKSKMGLTELK